MRPESGARCSREAGGTITREHRASRSAPLGGGPAASGQCRSQPTRPTMANKRDLVKRSTVGVESVAEFRQQLGARQRGVEGCPVPDIPEMTTPARRESESDSRDHFAWLESPNDDATRVYLSVIRIPRPTRELLLAQGIPAARLDPALQTLAERGLVVLRSGGAHGRPSAAHRPHPARPSAGAPGERGPGRRRRSLAHLQRVADGRRRPARHPGGPRRPRARRGGHQRGRGPGRELGSLPPRA